MQKMSQSVSKNKFSKATKLLTDNPSMPTSEACKKFGLPLSTYYGHKVRAEKEEKVTPAATETAKAVKVKAKRKVSPPNYEAVAITTKSATPAAASSAAPLLKLIIGTPLEIAALLRDLGNG